MGSKKKKPANTRGYSTTSIPKKAEVKEKKQNSSSVTEQEPEISHDKAHVLPDNPTEVEPNDTANDTEVKPNDTDQEMAKFELKLEEKEISSFSLAQRKATKESESDARKKELNRTNPSIGRLILSKKQESDLCQWFEENQRKSDVIDAWKSVFDLKVAYLRLEMLGFENDKIEEMIEKCPFSEFDSVLEWACLTLPVSKLPYGFTDKFEHDALDSCIEGVVMERRQTEELEREDEIVDLPVSLENIKHEEDTSNASLENIKHEEDTSNASLGNIKHEEDTSNASLDFNKRWILERAAEQTDDDQSSTYSDTPTKPSQQVLETELQDLILQASESKSSGKREKLKEIGREIGKLKQLLGSQTIINLPRVAVKEEDVASKACSDEDDSNLFFNEDLIFENAVENSSTIITIREMNSECSNWTGMSPSELLQELVSKLSLGSDIKYSTSKPISNGFQSIVSISNTPYKFGMSKDEYVTSKNDAKLFAATKALFSLTDKSPSVASRLPPSFSQLYKEWIEAEISAAKLAHGSKLKRINQFAEKIMQFRNINIDTNSTPTEQENEDFNISSGKQTLKRLPSLKEWRTCTNNEFLEQRKDLPVFQKQKDIVDLITQNQVVVISSETGSGKSTQIPTFLLQSAIESGGNQFNLICTQPRRISAISLASRVAQETGYAKQRIIGYQVKNDSSVSDNTVITFCTTGLLLRRMVSDPFLKSVTHIVIDECHERTLDSDFLLLLVKNLLSYRLDLKVVLMSATANSDLFANYFKSECKSKVVPTISIPGRSFPVTHFFLQDIIMKTKYSPTRDSEYLIKTADTIRSAGSVQVSGKGGKKQTVRIVWREAVENDSDFEDFEDSQNVSSSDNNNHAAKIMKKIDPKKINYELISLLIAYILKENPANCSDGSCIIFLPGVGEINRLTEILENDFDVNNQSKTPRLLVLPLHGGLPNREQSRVFAPGPDGVLKVVLSTNVAETGVTIPDAVYVIDTLRAREIRHDTRKGISRLADTLIAKANALQRRGRAGRVRPGFAFHLIPFEDFQLLPNQQTPEMQRLPLEEICLKMKMTMRNMNESLQSVFEKLLDPPSAADVVQAVSALEFAEALDDQERLTKLGELLGDLPVDIRVGKLLLIGVWLGCTDSALTIASLLTARKHPFIFPSLNQQQAKIAHQIFYRGDSDIMSWVAAYNEWEKLWLDGKSQSAVRMFCQLRFLNFDVLLSVYETRLQLLETLISLGIPCATLPKYSSKYPSCKIKFLPTFNEYSKDPIMNSIVYSIGLYPNVIFKSSGKFGGNGSLHLSRATNQKMSIKLHGNSVTNLKDISSSYFAFNSIQMSAKSKSICYLYDLNLTHAIVYPLLAAKSLQYKPLQGVFCFDKDFIMECLPRSAAILKQLRMYLKDSFLKFLGSISALSGLEFDLRGLDETRKLLINMDRKHLFEFHDQTWFPTFLRDELTTYLNAMWQLDLPFGLGKALYVSSAYVICGEILKEKLMKMNQKQVVDICSGAGGPIPKMATHFFNTKENGVEKHYEAFFTLTDLFPNLSCAASLPVTGPVKYITSPVDACSLPKNQSFKFRTSFGSFHHLPVPVARAIFQDVVNSGCGIGIFEATGRDVFSIIGSIFFLPMLCAYLTIFDIRPVTFTRILFFFIIPIMPFLLVIDGSLSNLRTYEHHDYMEVLASVEGALEYYDWEYVKKPVMDLRESSIYRYAIGKFFADLAGRLFLIRVLTGIPKTQLNQTFLEIPLDR